MGKSRITLETEVLKMAVLLGVATAGGTISLVLGDLTPLKKVLAGGGFVVTIALIGFVLSKYRWLKDQTDRRTRNDWLRTLCDGDWPGSNFQPRISRLGAHPPLTFGASEFSPLLTQSLTVGNKEAFRMVPLACSLRSPYNVRHENRDCFGHSC